MCGGSSAKTDRTQTLKSYGQLGDVYGTLTGLGKKLTTAGAENTDKASRHFSDIMSGDPTKVLAASQPEISAITAGADQQKRSLANFGDRTGGKNAAAQGIQEKVRGQVSDVIAGKRDAAGKEIARIGGQETGQGLSATEGSGSISAALADLSIKSRTESQKIHNAAVQQWAKLVADVLAAGAGAA